jgi:hypothetical protein
LKLPFSVLLVAALAACYDPVHADDVKSLGDEAPGVPEGPFHRPGQHCTTCHGADGPGSPEFSIAGTIYAREDQPEPEVLARITLRDKLDTKYVLFSNSVGNFYVEKEAWDPVFPVEVFEVMRAGAEKPIPPMKSTIGRDGGCGGCHRGSGDRFYQPQVYIESKPQTP